MGLSDDAGPSRSRGDERVGGAGVHADAQATGGEHGGDPDSVKFCHKLGLTHVSCSPFRVPVARLAATQAAIEEKRKTATAKKK